jgi:hypothetical protein
MKFLSSKYGWGAYVAAFMGFVALHFKLERIYSNYFTECPPVDKFVWGLVEVQLLWAIYFPVVTVLFLIAAYEREAITQLNYLRLALVLLAFHLWLWLVEMPFEITPDIKVFLLGNNCALTFGLTWLMFYSLEKSYARNAD